MRRGGRVDEGGRLEIYCGATHRGFESHPLRHLPGEVTEWSKVHDWKSCVPQGTAGSNPALSAIAAVRGGDGRVPMTERREPRQVREEATVSTVSGHGGARPSPPRTSAPFAEVSPWPLGT